MARFTFAKWMAASVGCVLCATAAHAAVITEYDASGSTAGGATPLSIGRQFTVTGTGITLEQVGIVDTGANGLGQSHQVRVFSLNQLGAGASATEIPAGATVVPAGVSSTGGQGTSTTNAFQYASLSSPLFLAAGNYAIVGYNLGVSPNDPYTDGGGIPAAGNNVTPGNFDPYQVGYSGTTGYPANGDGNNHGSISFRFEVGNVPEPASLGLVGLGGLRLLVRRRRA